MVFILDYYIYFRFKSKKKKNLSSFILDYLDSSSTESWLPQQTSVPTALHRENRYILSKLLP